MIFFWIVITIIVAIFSASIGKIDLDLIKIFDTLTMEYQIFTQIRLPRVILAFTSGGILALSGLLFQTLFRNPLTTPFTLGVSSGATLGAAIAIIFGFSFVSFFGFIGAISTIFVIYFFSKKLNSNSDQRLILVGIALSFLYSSMLLIIYYLSDFQESYLILRFTMGSLLTVGFGETVPIILSATIVIFVSQKYKNELKLLSISSDFAFLEGVNVDRVLIILFVSISLAIGIVVSIVGPISFIGLITPHIIRTILKKSIDQIIIPTFIAGGLFLLICDTIARNLPTISEIPVGIITSFIGGIVFVYILISSKKY
jgi:iron complex transport system permease protein